MIPRLAVSRAGCPTPGKLFARPGLSGISSSLRMHPCRCELPECHRTHVHGPSPTKGMMRISFINSYTYKPLHRTGGGTVTAHPGPESLPVPPLRFMRIRIPARWTALSEPDSPGLIDSVQLHNGAVPPREKERRSPPPERPPAIPHHGEGFRVTTLFGASSCAVLMRPAFGPKKKQRRCQEQHKGGGIDSRSARTEAPPRVEMNPRATVF